MNAREFRWFLDRDEGCLHCGDVETAVPHHRRNRGLGGSKIRDVPSNIIVMCSRINSLMESDMMWAVVAQEYGWKLRAGDNPLEVPVFDMRTGEWWILDDLYQRREATPGGVGWPRAGREEPA